LSEDVVSVSEFMERRAVDLRTGGRYSLASRHDSQGNRREFACRTTRISPFQMLVAAPVLGPKGERVITFFGELGKLDGWITDVAESGFLVDIAVTKKVRTRLASKLAWLDKKQKDAVVDVRQQHRLVPENPHTTIIFADGTTLSCFVIDVSPSGVAVSADIEPEIGTRLAVGRSVGYVVRRFNEGFAVQFDQLLPGTDLEVMIRPPVDAPVYRASPPLAPRPELVTPAPRKLCSVTGSAALLPQESIWLID
jgi:hypothetical protein